MPTMPPTFRPAHLPSRKDARRQYDQERGAQPWRHWYWTARWRRIAKAQLDAEPLCRMCKAKGLITAASVCDHVVPHRGDSVLFWEGERQSLCAPCHSSDKQADER